MNLVVFLKSNHLELPRPKVLDGSGSTFGDLRVLTLIKSYMGFLIAGKGAGPWESHYVN